MNLRPFDEVNEYLLKRMADRNEYVGQVSSYFKIVQHGLVYSFNRTQTKLIEHYLYFPLFIQNIRYILIGIGYFLTSSKPQKHTLILDPGREVIDSEGKTQSVFFKKLLDVLPKDQTTSVCFKPIKPHYSDFSCSQFPTLSFTWSKQEFDRIRDVSQVIGKMRQSQHYTKEEMNYISSAFHVFLEQYLHFFGLFKKLKPKRILFIAHYHNEGIIAAANDLNIEIIELQHGLISTKDLYYVYNPVFKNVLENALFPNSILLYGQYWQDLLEKGAEWKHNQFKILGSSMIGQDDELTEIPFDQKENIILVASQKGMEQLFIPLIHQLLIHIEKHPDWRVIVKLHPYETELESYYAIQHPQLEFAPIKSTISDYFIRIKIQISIYSTTLFDAAGHTVVNFIWKKKGLGQDYAEDLIQHKIGIGITEEMDPIAYLKSEPNVKSHFLSRTHLYSRFNPMILNTMKE